MTTDRRELVLVRLLAILATVPPIQVVVRNRGELPAEKRPAIVLLDGDETARLNVAQSRGRLTAAPCFVDMTPEIFVVMDAREPPNALIGKDMNTLRIAIVRAIYADADLKTILSSNGEIRYGGTSTDMASGRSMEGQMHIRLVFTYPLLPSELGV